MEEIIRLREEVEELKRALQASEEERKEWAAEFGDYDPEELPFIMAFWKAGFANQDLMTDQQVLVIEDLFAQHRQKLTSEEISALSGKLNAHKDGSILQSFGWGDKAIRKLQHIAFM